GGAKTRRSLRFLRVSASPRPILRPQPLNGHTRSILFESIQLLSSAFKNSISSRTSVNACAYAACEFSIIGQSVAHISRCGPNASYSRFTNPCASFHGYDCLLSDQQCEIFTNRFGYRFSAINFSNSPG